MPELTCLILSNNSLGGEELVHLKNLPKLSTLKLDKNKIEDLEAFNELASMPELKHINIAGN